MCESHQHAHARAHAFSHADCCTGPLPHPLRGCCEPPLAHHHGRGCCDADHGFGFRRRFVSREEKIARLEAYLADLQAEAKGVQEKLARLRESG